MLPGMPDSPIPPDPGTSVTSRGDACPGALRLHAADDGFLARVRIPGGVLTVPQARALGAAAGRLGDGVLHLTSRGNVQLRGLRDGCGGELAERLGAAGLLPSAAHERVRNVVASPMSGLDGRGHVDVRGWLTGLDAALCASSVTPELSGRFLFALDDGRGDVAALAPDVLLRGLPDGSALLRLATEPAGLRLPYDTAARAAVLASEVFAESAREVTGRRVWRVRELGLAEGELMARVGDRLHGAGLAWGPARGAGNCATSHDGAAAADGSATGNGAKATGLRPGPRSSNAGGAEVFPPFGTITGDQWADLTDRAAQLPQQELRLTPWRGIVIPGAEPTATEPTPWTRVAACIGRPGCAKSHADVRADATAHLADAHPDLPTYWSGCERRCGRPTGPYVDVVARPDGTYDINHPHPATS